MVMNCKQVGKIFLLLKLYYDKIILVRFRRNADE